MFAFVKRSDRDDLINMVVQEGVERLVCGPQSLIRIDTTENYRV